MDDKSKTRVTMLALSGVLFGITGFGWLINKSSTPHIERNSVSSTTGGASGNTAADSAADVTTSAVTSPVLAASSSSAGGADPATAVYPSTRMEDAVRAARESIRKDPVQPLQAASTRVLIASAPHRQYRGGQTNFVPPPPNTRLLDPPPVSDPSLYQQGLHLGSPMEVMEKRSNKLAVQDFRLVGLIDGKAIFKVRRKVAEDLQLPSAFTLGKGESFNNIKLDAVGDDSATVHNGSEVSTKALESVH